MHNGINNSECHMGHLIMECLRRCPEAICQIDAATGKEETNASVLSRSVRLARCFRRLGLTPGDVLALGGNNHLDLHIPYYAALINGVPIVGVDPLFKYGEIKKLFKITEPRIAFCQQEHYLDYLTAIQDLGLQTQVVTFDGEHSLADLLEEYDDNGPIDDFEPAKFDAEKINAWLVGTGGTTGGIKIAPFTHKAWIRKVLGTVLKYFRSERAPESIRSNALNLAPVQWISGFFNPMAMPLLNQTKVQTSAPATTEHVIEIINKYKPVSTMFSPSLASGILNHDTYCDLTCFNIITLAGSKIYRDILIALKKRMREDAVLSEMYGQTETLGPVFSTNTEGPLGSCGKKNDMLKIVKLMDPETGKEITEPHTPGELWTKRDDDFKGYYNDPEETAAAFTEDGWYRTGDILYRDEEDNFFFVERVKMLIKYKNYQVIPLELEEVIREHPSVLDVSVTCVSHAADGELPVACVVRSPGSKVSAQDIKDLVADKLSDPKRLRGGVVFMEELPLTSSGKVARGKLRQMVINLHRE